MVRHHDTRASARTEEALTVLFCLVDDAYAKRLLTQGGRGRLAS